VLTTALFPPAGRLPTIGGSHFFFSPERFFFLLFVIRRPPGSPAAGSFSSPLDLSPSLLTSRYHTYPLRRPVSFRIPFLHWRLCSTNTSTAHTLFLSSQTGTVLFSPHFGCLDAKRRPGDPARVAFAAFSTTLSLCRIGLVRLPKDGRGASSPYLENYLFQIIPPLSFPLDRSPVFFHALGFLWQWRRTLVPLFESSQTPLPFLALLRWRLKLNFPQEPRNPSTVVSLLPPPFFLVYSTLVKRHAFLGP